MTDSATDLRPGDVVGGYRIESLVGRGRTAAVYRAVGPNDDEVALKLIARQIADDPVLVRRFEREAQLAERISHPHLVAIRDHGQHGSMPYLVLELVSGGSLGELIRDDGPLELAKVVRLLGQVAAGADALHEKGVVHRDITSDNILLDADGGAYLSDLGLAKDTQGTVITRPGQALGSLNYIAPEQIRGEDVSPVTDVYALGCVLWESLVGTPPFGGRPSMRTLFAHLQEPPPDLTRARPDVSADVASAVGRALNKRPGDRPAGAVSYIRAVARAARLPA